MKRLTVVVISMSLFFLSLAPLSPVSAQTKEFSGPCVGSKYTTPEGEVVNATDVPTIQGLECLVANIMSVAITLIGIVAFVMFLVGGFQYLTAGANAKGVEQGKNSIVFAILGIVVAIASIAILNLISRLTGVETILKFSTQFGK